jgi:hypothetical protein
MRLAVLTLPFVAGLIVAAACTTSGDLPPTDGGYIVADGSFVEVDGERLPTGGYACVFAEQASYSCPGQTLAPTPWQAQCFDGDDCLSRVTGTQTVAGCTATVQYRDVHLVDSTCAAWLAEGGTLPVVDAGPVPVCAPSNAAFTPSWHTPRVVPGACTQALIDSYRQCLDDSIVTANPPSCASWTGTLSAANKTCLSCLVSNESDSTYGPIVELPTETLINLPGCIAVAEGKTDGSGCGGALSAFEQCGRAACLPTCPTGNAAEVATESACETSTDLADGGGVCGSYATAADCADAIETDDAGTAAEKACFGLPTGSSDAVFQAVALALCGG